MHPTGMHPCFFCIDNILAGTTLSGSVSTFIRVSTISHLCVILHVTTGGNMFSLYQIKHKVQTTGQNKLV